MTSLSLGLPETSKWAVTARVLVVEDDVAVQRSLRQLFQYEGYGVDVAPSGKQCLALMQANPPTAIVLDAQLSDISGQEIFRRLRRLVPSTPIIVVSARSSVAEKVLFLDLGAADYVTKPFSERELLARLRAAMRRAVTSPGESQLSFDDVTVDFGKMELLRAGCRIRMTALEFKVLRFMTHNLGRVISRSELLNEVWGYQNYPTTRTVDNHILRLRQKLEKDPSNPVHFQTVHSMGYRFVITETEEWYSRPGSTTEEADCAPNFQCQA